LSEIVLQVHSVLAARGLLKSECYRGFFSVCLLTCYGVALLSVGWGLMLFRILLGHIYGSIVCFRWLGEVRSLLAVKGIIPHGTDSTLTIGR